MRFLAAFANISLLFGGRKKPYPTPHNATRHRKSPTVGCAGNNISEPIPRQKINTPMLDNWVALKRFASRPENGAHSATAIGPGVKTCADFNTPYAYVCCSTNGNATNAMPCDTNS